MQYWEERTQAKQKYITENKPQTDEQYGPHEMNPDAREGQTSLVSYNTPIVLLNIIT
jgi:hypothetical protein